MSIYEIVMIIQFICLIVTAGCLGYFYTTAEKGRARDGLVLIAAAALLTAGGYALFLQATDIGGLRAAQKVYLTGKIFAPSFLAMFYFYILKPEKRETGYRQACFILLIVSVAAEIFMCSDTLQKFIFSEPVLEQNQYFYYIGESMTRLSLFYLGIQFCLLAACSGAVLICGIRNRLTAEKAAKRSRLQMEILFLVPLLLLAAEGISFFPQARHYDFTSLAAALSVCLLIPAGSAGRQEQAAA